MFSPSVLLTILGLSRAAYPYMEGDADDQHQNEIRGFEDDADFLQFTLDDASAFITPDAGGLI